jgi:hypothetical protein
MAGQAGHLIRGIVELAFAYFYSILIPTSNNIEPKIDITHPPGLSMASPALGLNTILPINPPT